MLDRDGHQCTWKTGRDTWCGAEAREVDHIGDRDDHRPENLRALCTPHHRERTSRQANEIREQRRYRPAERHPGFL
ncbi:hypothetical protein [Pseudonocardia alni]|uniref:hypothetical protein n=1 Tax=Pseudonocardia alni TaxID=33907 RepID=UPI0033312835